MEPLFTISRDDWSLHRKGHLDQERHKQKVKEAIKKNLADIVSEESIIMSGGKDIIKVPIRSIKQFKFRFNDKDQEQVGQGSGDSSVGDIIDKAKKGQVDQAGEAPGEDYYETEINIDELAELIFADLHLPNLKPKQHNELTDKEVEFNDIRKKGIMSNIDKKRTIIESFKRQARGNVFTAQSSVPEINITPDDLRFKTWDMKEKPITNAIVLAMMDTSASMGTFEKYIARSFYFWMVRFLRSKYQQVEILFLAHDAEAKEVTEEQFFQKGESGGTKCSSVYRLANEIIDERYSPEFYNNYAFHFSDGDNWPSDNHLTIKYATELVGKCSMTGYGEINPRGSVSTLMEVVKEVKDPAFITCTIREKEDVYSALKTFFGTQLPQ
ncbi:sporulation protein YhbH [Halalkalibacter lacteus]|uniref:sporulation protein YhbH n=1 Tax=Halalkalibacter lacteus TaxID=3090663 RepID=UPI002FC8883A